MEKHANHLEIKPVDTRRSEISISEEGGKNPLVLENQKTETAPITDNKVQVYQGEQEIQEIQETQKTEKTQTIAGASFIFAKTSIGLTILTFGVRASQFGLFWFLVFSALCAVINIWSEIRLVQSVDNIEEREYSKVVEIVLGKVWAKILNVFLFSAPKQADPAPLMRVLRSEPIRADQHQVRVPVRQHRWTRPAKPGSRCTSCRLRRKYEPVQDAH